LVFLGLLRNAAIFVATAGIIVLLIKFSKRLDKKPEIIKKPECKFKITEPKFKSVENKKFATYSVLINEKHHVFFVEFPLLFKFYSEENFKSKVKIAYRVPKDPVVEEIMNKDMVFTGTPKEYRYFINDIIMGKIDIEIELNTSYGNPTISFEILPNDLCDMRQPCKIEIKFPE
jgi:hypothetical protein